VRISRIRLSDKTSRRLRVRRHRQLLSIIAELIDPMGRRIATIALAE